MPKVFISYSSRNLRKARRLAQALQNRGIDVWFAEWDVLVGHNLLDSIYSGIRESDFLAVILTEHSVKSKWVKDELDSAKMDELEKGGTKILPLLFEKCEIPNYLRTKKYANFINFNRGIEELIQTLLPEARKSIALHNANFRDRNGQIKRIQAIQSISIGTHRQYDDLFLGCISFEDRSTWCLKNYPSKSIKSIILFQVGEFSEISRQAGQIRTKEYLLNKSDTVLTNEGSCTIFNWKNFDNLDETLSISRLLKKHIGEKDRPYVSIDISPFPHPYFLQLLKILDNLTQNIRVFYVSPSGYYPGGGIIGVKEIQYLHYGVYAPDKPILLIIFPGFSGETAFAIKDAINPHRTIVMFPKMDMWQQSLSFASKSHKLLLESSDVVTRHISTADPFSVQKELEELKNEYADYNWVVAPQGSKLQSLGLHLFARENRDIISAFAWAKPERYMTELYTRGVGQAYMAYI